MREDDNGSSLTHRIQLTARAQPPQRLKHIRELDGIRGLAALMVFFHHIFSASIPEGSTWPLCLSWLIRASRFGDQGVDLFFVLSGFLITSILIEDRENCAYYRDFYWKRALRILPLYIVCLAGILIFLHQGKYVILSVFFVANFASVFRVAVTGPFWSLAIEEQFYLLWPTVVRRRSILELRYWCAAVGCTTVVLRFVFAYFGHYNEFLTFLRCDGLAFGAWLACCLRSRASQYRHLRTLLACMIIVGLTLQIVSTQAAPALGSAIAHTGVTIFCGGIVGLAIAFSGTPGLALFRSRLLTFFGLISYAFYMFHTYVLQTYDKFRGPMLSGDQIAFWVRFALVSAVTIVLSLISRYCIELPALNLRRYVLK